MKQFVTIFLILFLSVTVFARSTPGIYRVKFTNKGNSSYSISRPSEFLSLKSIERRLLQQIPLTESDLPVNPEYLKALKNSGAEILYSSKWLNLAIVKVDNEAVVEKIRQESFVLDIKAVDYVLEKQSSSKLKQFFDRESYNKIPNHSRTAVNKSGRAYDYGFSLNQAQMINIDEMHNLGFNGRGVTIAVIDGGFNSANTMAVFDSIRLNGQILGTRDFVQPDNDVYGTTMSAHGTMVLSTMGGNLPGQLVGTAPKASFWLLRSEDVMAEYLMEEYYWVNAAEYADSVGADIINSSLGYTTFDDPSENHSYEDMDGNTAIVTIGADLAASKGMLVVNSAGNSGNSSWHYIGAPADGDSVLTIGAVNSSGIYASFSSVGPTSDGRIKPDISAQGEQAVIALVPSGTATGNGTSFSSPIIAGAAACLWQANPTYTNMELINAIRMSGSQSSNPDNFKGWGIPNFMLANNLLTAYVLQKKEPFSGLSVYPIPFSGRINIEMEATTWLSVDIKIINSIGHVVAEMKGVELNKGINLVVFTKLERLPSGIYMVQISDGFYVAAEKIIK
ncbi:MAG: S8 family serine peptidase [Bacteroidales bacterium]|nr:S8 family serine peptidase [Bacteroidales bacterium]